MTEQNLNEQLTYLGQGVYFEQLKPHLRNAIHLKIIAQPESGIPIGVSKIGGLPDLPDTLAWPIETRIKTKRQFLFFGKKTSSAEARPLSFIAQINFSEIKKFDADDLLPSRGIAYFFYCSDQDSWGYDPAQKDKFRVLFDDGTSSNLKRTNFPSDLPDFGKYKPCRVEASQETSLPSLELIHNIFKAEKDFQFYEHFLEDGRVNKVLGHADVIQDEMELECELVSNGLYCGDSSGFNNPLAKTLEPNAKNWRLLLQIDSNDEAGMMWGDLGRLYFWIKIEDLKERRFDRMWMILQCT